MNGNTVPEGNTIHDRVGCSGTAAPVLLRNALHWPQASSGINDQETIVATIKPLPMQHLGAVIAG